MKTDAIIAVVIPALNEAAAIARVVEQIPAWVNQTIVVDNGSSDDTANVAAAQGALVVHEPRRGYGAACLRGLTGIQKADIVVFLDADHSDFPGQMDRLVKPILENRADLVIGSRTMGRAESGALTLPQRLGNALAGTLLRLIWRQRTSDLGPFRAIRFDALQALQMSDLGFGWTIQMQVRALRKRMRVVEAPVDYRKRIGKSKISGTLSGVVGAGTKILSTIVREAIRPSDTPYRRRRLMVFARYPRPGHAKTRLIPALGAHGAADLQQDMNHHTFNMARRWARSCERQVEIRFTGGDQAQMAGAFGNDLRYVDQGQGSLGERLLRAFEHADAGGLCAAVAIGADCPSLDPATIDTAFRALETHDVVFGPASDGGYYLIGMRHPQAELFSGIAWGTADVYRQTCEKAHQLGWRVANLPVMDDIDEPQDLAVWERAKPLGSDYARPRFSVIIPAINEAQSLPEALASIGSARDTEVLLVDGGSQDATCDIARTWGARIVSTDAGRARQMNVGAEAARGDVLIFLHADTRLPFGWRQRITEVLHDPTTAAGAFCLGFSEARMSLRFIELGANIRSHFFRLPYGDQIIVVWRTVFRDLGGFPQLPVMEDYAFMRRLRRHGRIRMAQGAALTSPRRWITYGTWRTTLMHQCMILGYSLGVSPNRLARWRNISSTPQQACPPDPMASDPAAPNGQHRDHCPPV